MKRIPVALRRLVPAVPPQLEGRLRIEQVDTLASLGGAIGCVGVLAAICLFVSFWRSASHGYLIFFLSTFVVLYSAAFRRSLIWRTRPKPAEMSWPAYRTRNLHVGVIGLLWATMPIGLAPHADANQFLIIVYVSSGLIASSVMIAPTLMAAFLVSVPVMVSTFSAMLITRGTDGPILSFLVIVYSALVFVCTFHSYRSFIQRAVSRMELDEKREVVSLLLREFEAESSDWLWRTDENGYVQHVSARMHETIGTTTEALSDIAFVNIIAALASGGPDQAVICQLSQRMERREPFQDLLLRVALPGNPSWWRLTGKPAFAQDGTFRGYFGVCSDVTDAEDSRARMGHMATHDSLTGLPNRYHFQQALAAAYAGPEATFALLWADLNHFKGINDSLGHAVGDAVLINVSERLKACVGGDDTVARLGGDEFVILSTSTDATRAALLADEIIRAISQPFHVENMRLSVGVSVGVSISPQDGGSPQELLRSADLALYEAKGSGGGARFFATQMDVEFRERRALQSDLRLGLERQEFSLVFQPIIDPTLERVVTFEALLRWNHTTQGNIPPDRFIPLAEEYGLICQIGEWVLRSACATATGWPSGTSVSVNLSALQFRDPLLLQVVESALRDSGLDAHRLTLEITESTTLQADESVLMTLRNLRNLGISVALDDFGTGFSSLSYLRRLPIDKLKIDRSFVRDIEVDGNALSIVRAIVAMARSLNISVIAEGVETARQLELLKAQDCGLVQGYYYSRPLDPAAADLYLKNMRGATAWPGAEPESEMTVATPIQASTVTG